MPEILSAAWAAFQAGDSHECTGLLRELVAKNPGLPSPDLILVEFHLDVKQRSEARKLLESIAAEDATHPQLYLSYAKLALSEGRLLEALMHFEKMDSLGPQRGWSDEQELEFQAAILSGKATVAERRGNWDEGARILTEWTRLQPEAVGIRQRLGKALLMDDRERKAYEQFDIAYRQDPTVAHPDAAIGAIYMNMGDVRRANEHFASALKDTPNDGPLCFAWSIALLYQDRLQEADEYAKNAEATGLETRKLLMQRGKLAWALGRYEEAARYFQRLIDSSPDDEAALYYLILAKASHEQDAVRKEAHRMAEKFVSEKPKSSAAVAALGYSLHTLRQNAEAERVLGPIASHANLPPEILLIYGKVLAVNGKVDDAKRVAERLNENMIDYKVFLVRSAAKKWIDSMMALP